jgi:D-alanine-D-alanine ligase
MDKLAFSGVMAAAGLPVLPRLLLSPTSEPPPFDGPYIVKPRFGGSSIGIEILADIDSARARLSTNPHLNQGAIIEPFRSDMFDLQVGVKSWPIKSISQIERPLKSSSLNPFLTYAEKYVGGAGMATAPREFPASIDPLLAQKLRTTADAASDLLSIRGLARLDFLSDGHDLVINEVNTIPGSLSHYLWKSPDTSFYKLIHEMMTEARERGTHSYSAAGADGRVLSESTEIASKLA